MIRVSARLSRVLLGTAVAAALCLPASAAPISGEVFVKLPAGTTAAKDDHKNHIEILSYSFGAPGQFGEWIADVERPAEAARANDRLRTAGPKDGTAAKKPTTRPLVLAPGETRPRPAAGRGIDIARVDGEIVSPGAPAASGLPTGKRQHKPVTLSMPVDKGSVMLKLASAWPDCQVGKRYAELELGDGGKSYTLQDAVVSSCASESISLYYSGVKVRGWDPKKKEE
jgi:hypothetical protein